MSNMGAGLHSAVGKPCSTERRLLKIKSEQIIKDLKKDLLINQFGGQSCAHISRL